MNERVYEALRAAVNVAREQQLMTVDDLKLRLVHKGFAEQEVDEALQFWAHREVQLAAKRV
jgi:hypothetical protein